MSVRSSPDRRRFTARVSDAAQVFQRLGETVPPEKASDYGAFFSSELGGIVLDPAYMVLHADDHMFTRGHGAYDTVTLSDGYLYLLDRHVERLQASAEAMGIPMEYPDSTIKRILLDTAAASRKLNGAPPSGAVALHRQPPQ
jgi:4-amino-4-deoxychorismate lyase